MEMAFWAFKADTKRKKTQQSETRNFINKVRNIQGMNKRGGNAKKQSVH
jgi:hypothetical protein